MWENILQILSHIATVLTIISAGITGYSALKIKSYYEKIITLYSIEDLTLAEQQAINAKKEYQKLKEMYVNSRGVDKRSEERR